MPGSQTWLLANREGLNPQLFASAAQMMWASSSHECSKVQQQQPSPGIDKQGKLKQNQDKHRKT